MSQTPVQSPQRRAQHEIPGERAPAGRPVCPFANNCACVFAGVPTSTEHSESMLTHVRDVVLGGAVVDPEAIRIVAARIDEGWSVVGVDDRGVALQRPHVSSLCLNVMLTVMTGLLWLIYWIPTALRSKIDTQIVLVPVPVSVSAGLLPAGSVSAVTPQRPNIPS